MTLNFLEFPSYVLQDLFDLKLFPDGTHSDAHIMFVNQLTFNHRNYSDCSM